MRSVLLLLAAALPLVVASNHTNQTDDDDSGLSGGAIAGIIIGALAGVGAIGGLVYYFYLRPGAKMGMGGGAASTAGPAGGNNLPMVALRVNCDEDI